MLYFLQLVTITANIVYLIVLLSYRNSITIVYQAFNILYF